MPHPCDNSYTLYTSILVSRVRCACTCTCTLDAAHGTHRRKVQRFTAQATRGERSEH